MANSGMRDLSCFGLYGGNGGGGWRRNATNQPPACSIGNERVPRTEGNLSFKRKGKQGERAGRR